MYVQVVLVLVYYIHYEIGCISARKIAIVFSILWKKQLLLQYEYNFSSSTMAMKKQDEQEDTATSNSGGVSVTAGHADGSNMSADTSSVPAPREVPEYDPERVVSLDQMEAVMNLLVHPVWIFDVKDRKMRWGNRAAQELFNAASLEDLQARDFTQMSPSVATRNNQLIQRCGLGLVTVDMWTFYPKGEAKTVRATVSGIRLLDDQTDPAVLPHICILSEGVHVEQRELDNELLRGVEMLRHLPIAVCQFDMQGACMFQNPEACLPQDTTTIDADSPQDLEDPHQDPLDKSQQDSSTNTNRKRKPADSGLLGRFVDPKVGKRVLQQVREIFPTTKPKQPVSDSCIELEAMLYTKRGRTWSALQLRQTTDPVTGQPVLLFNAFDKTDAVRARQERRAREQKSEFLAIMAHEIRTPLHQVTGFVDLLDQTPLDKEQKSFVRVLKSSAQGLMTVINDVLDYSKLEAGQMKQENIPYEPLAVTKGSLEAVRASCDEKNLYLRLDWDTQIPFKLKNDPNRLRQILLNLLSNAVKFTKEGGITLKATYVDSMDSQHCVNHVKGNVVGNNSIPQQMIKFSITDTGVGIPKEEKGIIFQKYQQANTTIARNYGGTGLGLRYDDTPLKLGSEQHRH
jgi:signal transduction histidine kinase